MLSKTKSSGDGDFERERFVDITLKEIQISPNLEVCLKVISTFSRLVGYVADLEDPGGMIVKEINNLNISQINGPVLD